jgi:chromosome segregation ATPase
MQFISLQQNVNILKNNKSENEQKIINLRAQSDKQIRDLVKQVKDLNNIKIQLENDNKIKEEKLIALDRKIKEMSVNYQKKFAELNNNYSEEKNNNYLNFNEKLKLKEQEIAKLNIKIQSLEENIQSLNDIIDLNDKQKEEKEELTENMTKLLSQISEKDRQIFELKGEITVLNDKITKERNDKKTQNMLNGITEKDLKNNINELKNIINEKDNELAELRTKYDNIKYNSKKLQPKIHFIEDSDDEIQNGNDEIMIDQIKEIQKTYKEREEKLLREKNEEIKKLRMRNNDLARESYLDNNTNIDMKKYINEIKRLKTINNNLEEDLGYYKELNNKFMDSEKRITVLETENIRLQNLLQKKEEEIDDIQIKYKKLEEENSTLEKQLVNSKGKLGDVLNELAEVETKCVHLEEEQRQMRKTVMNGGK